MAKIKPVKQEKVKPPFVKGEQAIMKSKLKNNKINNTLKKNSNAILSTSLITTKRDQKTPSKNTFKNNIPGKADSVKLSKTPQKDPKLAMKRARLSLPIMRKKQLSTSEESEVDDEDSDDQVESDIEDDSENDSENSDYGSDDESEYDTASEYEGVESFLDLEASEGEETDNEFLNDEESETDDQFESEEETDKSSEDENEKNEGKNKNVFKEIRKTLNKRLDKKKNKDTSGEEDTDEEDEEDEEEEIRRKIIDQKIRDMEERRKLKKLNKALKKKENEKIKTEVKKTDNTEEGNQKDDKKDTNIQEKSKSIEPDKKPKSEISENSEQKNSDVFVGFISRMTQKITDDDLRNEILNKINENKLIKIVSKPQKKNKYRNVFVHVVDSKTLEKLISYEYKIGDRTFLIHQGRESKKVLKKDSPLAFIARLPLNITEETVKKAIEAHVGKDKVISIKPKVISEKLNRRHLIIELADTEALSEVVTKSCFDIGGHRTMIREAAESKAKIELHRVVYSDIPEGVKEKDVRNEVEKLVGPGTVKNINFVRSTKILAFVTFYTSESMEKALDVKNSIVINSKIFKAQEYKPLKKTRKGIVIPGAPSNLKPKQEKRNTKQQTLGQKRKHEGNEVSQEANDSGSKAKKLKKNPKTNDANNVQNLQQKKVMKETTNESLGKQKNKKFNKNQSPKKPNEGQSGNKKTKFQNKNKHNKENQPQLNNINNVEVKSDLNKVQQSSTINEIKKKKNEQKKNLKRKLNETTNPELEGKTQESPKKKKNKQEKNLKPKPNKTTNEALDGKTQELTNKKINKQEKNFKPKPNTANEVHEEKIQESSNKKKIKQKKSTKPKFNEAANGVLEDKIQESPNKKKNKQKLQTQQSLNQSENQNNVNTTIPSKEKLENRVEELNGIKKDKKTIKFNPSKKAKGILKRKKKINDFDKEILKVARNFYDGNTSKEIKRKRGVTIGPQNPKKKLVKI